MQRQPTDNFEQPTLSYQPTRDRPVRTPPISWIALAFAVLSVSSFAILAFRGSTDSAATLFLLSWIACTTGSILSGLIGLWKAIRLRGAGLVPSLLGFLTGGGTVMWAGYWFISNFSPCH